MATQAISPQPLPRTESRFIREARKWWTVFGVFVQDAIAYRAVAFIWVLTDTIPAIVMPLVWKASFNGRSEIAGFAPTQITAYYLVLLAVTNMVQCHQMWEIAADIREGRIAAYLVRPFSYRTMNYLSFLAWRVMRTVVFLPVFLVALFLFRDSLRWQDYAFSWEFVASIFLGHLVAFSVTYAFGLLALYFTETRSINNAWYMPTVLFSGQLAPLAMFPDAIRTTANWLPYRYTLSLPTEIFLRKISQTDALLGMGAQVLWIIAASLLGNLLWREGVKRYTGVGQ